MHKFIAAITVTLHYDDEREPVCSDKHEIEFVAEAEDAEEAWEEFMENSSLDMVTFPDGIDPSDPLVLEEQWEHHSIRRMG